jgi:hypothetical protein
MLLPVEIDDVWTYPETGTRYRVEGLPTVRNAIYDCEVNHSGMSREPKWVPGVRYVTIDPKDPIGQGDNQEFIRTRDNFQRSFQKVNVWGPCKMQPLPEGTCLECGGEGQILDTDKVEAEICPKCGGL